MQILYMYNFAEQAANTFSHEFKTVLSQFLASFGAKNCMWIFIGRWHDHIHTRAEEVWKIIKYFHPETSGFIFVQIATCTFQMN